MKTFVLAFTFLVSSAAAFAPSQIACRSDASATALNLFGGKKEGGDNKGAMGGMMDQLAMFKKAQEIATKKQAIEKELQLLTFDGKSSNEKVAVSMKYMPSLNPMDPQPEFEVQGSLLMMNGTRVPVQMTLRRLLRRHTDQAYRQPCWVRKRNLRCWPRT
ncbi:hypothetical protein MHU86_443 [Fragilaria crotonensis]|nr:hypothetical protein MHU86_443 [Fragilaria crotonensis]